MSEAYSESLITNGLSVRVAWARMALGFFQGLALYGLMRVDADGTRLVSQNYSGLVTFMVGFLPLLMVSSLGHLSKRQLVLWGVMATSLVALLGGYDIWRREAYLAWPSFELVVNFVFCFYIAQAMVLAGANEHKKIASYNGYFEQAWKLLIQVLLSLLFIGVVWLVLWMGASLFSVLGLTFLREMLGELWFYLPVTSFFVATSIHITDVNPSVIRSVRTLLLTLFAWLLPLATLFVVGFLAMLPWTGLELLWATRHATWILLGTMLVLILLINAAYQNGLSAHAVAAAVRISAKAAMFCLLPVVMIAIYALGLRVSDYGWTNDRLMAAVGVGLSLSYAVGYAWTATRPNWLKPMARVNTFNAFLFLSILLIVHSPLGDVRRLSVNNQLARLDAGKVSPQDFDYRYLRFKTDRYGREALMQLSRRTGDKDAEVIREKANETMAFENQWSRYQSEKKQVSEVKSLTQKRADAHVWPQGAKLPEGLLNNDWIKVEGIVPNCLVQIAYVCDVFLLSSLGQEDQSWLFIDQHKYQHSVVVRGNAERWQVVQELPTSMSGCSSFLKKMKEGHYQMVNKTEQDLMVGNVRILLRPIANSAEVLCPN